MDVGGGVFGRVELHHPVDVGEVEPARGDVGAEHAGLVLLQLGWRGEREET